MEKIWLNEYDVGVERIIKEVPSLADLIENTAKNYPDLPALKGENGVINYKEFNRITSVIAGNLRLFGLHRQEKICLFLPNCNETVLAFWSVVRGATVGVMTNPLYSEKELLTQIIDSDSKMLITNDLLIGKVMGIIDKTKLEKVFVVKTENNTEIDFSDERVLPWEELLMQNRGYTAKHIDSENDLALLQYTGGTTGISKGCMLTHKNLSANAEQCKQIFGVVLKTGKEKFVGVLPFFHIYGLQMSVILPVLLASEIIPVLRFTPRGLLSAIQAEKITTMASAPSIFGACLSQKDIDSYDLSSLKLIISGSAPLPVSQMETFEKKTGARISEGYGLSETSPVTHFSPALGKVRRPGSIGVPIPSTETKIVDVEYGVKELGVGEHGELCVRGPQVMKGYYKQPGQTEMVLRDGWLYTGDIACYDKDGFFYITDRKKDLIISGGYNIYPREVEEVLFAHPKIKEAVVIGIKDQIRGEAVKAFVVLNEGETLDKTELVTYCRKNLANYKLPREVEFRDSLPKSAVGKILRRELREEAGQIKA
ncbi:MAG: long-chain fatty acid--CoA ligase [Candidatus Riflebacteria bacterium]|jgi:long-chain acyl-CoA synthetase|nr:long-chain fatty acid--CoA ligase [Candidatus Riflebacteria bacterium]